MRPITIFGGMFEVCYTMAILIFGIWDHDIENKYKALTVLVNRIGSLLIVRSAQCWTALSGSTPETKPLLADSTTINGS